MIRKLILAAMFMTAAAYGQFGGATARHIGGGASLPAACSPNTGDIYTVIVIGVSSTPYFCDSPNHWALFGGGGGSGVTSLAGTANQITVSAATGAVTLSFPTGGVTLPGTTTLANPLAPGQGGTGIGNTATLRLGTSNQNWATLGTGIVKNTTTTGAISDAVSSDVYGLWTGTGCGTTTNTLLMNGNCGTPAVVTGGTCTNQVVTVISVTAVPTCTTLTPSYVSSTTGSGTAFALGTNPTFTTDIVTPAIFDSNGNVMAAFTTTASAVDGFTFTNSATGSPGLVKISATGTDTNISINLIPKGVGVGQIVIPSTTRFSGLANTNYGLQFGDGQNGAAVDFVYNSVMNMAMDLTSIAYSSNEILYWAPGALVSSATTGDTGIDRDGAGILGINNATQGTTAANYRAVKASAYLVGGTTFTLSANGCTATTLVGGATRGSYVSGTTGNCTVTILMGNSVAAATGFHCTFEDHTTLTVATGVGLLSQTGAADTTHCSMTGVTASGDLVSFSAEPY